jgi:2-hydroxy-3-keto-5-methylthiopentenyl-1-phosphate phosphatase
MALKIFADFDGTVTLHDVGNGFFETFGGPGYRDILKEYESETRSAQETFRWGAQAIGLVSRSAVDEFLVQQPIDETFRDFCDYCHANGIEFHIVSDGLDYYIEKILQHNGITGVSVFSNRLMVHPIDGDQCRFTVEFPFSDAECSRCACCKRNIVLTRAGDNDIIVYIGEGYSDRCAARYADIVFAKDALQTFCQQENISYYPYSSFGDIVDRLTRIRHTKLRKRHRAGLLRRQAFLRE